MIWSLAKDSDGNLVIIAFDWARKVEQKLTYETVETKFYTMEVALEKVGKRLHQKKTTFRNKWIDMNDKLNPTQKKNMRRINDIVIEKMYKQEDASMAWIINMRKEFVEFMENEMNERFLDIMKNYDKKLKKYKKLFSS